MKEVANPPIRQQSKLVPMKPTHILLVASVLLLGFSSCTSQEKLGYEAYDRMEYAQAVTHFRKAKNIDSDRQMQLKLAESYRMYNQLEDALPWYEMALEGNPDVDPDYKLAYAQTLRSTGHEEKAEQWFENYLVDRPNDREAMARWYSAVFTLDEEVENPQYAVTQLGVSSNVSSFSPSYYKNGIIVTSEGNRSGGNKKSAWTKRKFHEMLYVETDNNGNVAEITPLMPKSDSPYDDGPGVYDPNYNYVYFTRSNYIDGEVVTDSSNTVELSIFRTRMVDGKWMQPEPLPFSSKEYSCAHPAISADGKTLYFTSDMPGGQGGTDLYYSTMNAQGIFSPAVNLGDIINTEGDEVFPTVNVNKDGTETLYFSSTGHLGLGGLDIYKTVHNNGAWHWPEPLTAPINSVKDDFGFIYDGTADAGYFSSSRENEEGLDHVYRFSKATEGYLSVSVIDEKTREPITSSTVTIDGSSYATNADGTVLLAVDPEESYRVKAASKRYESTAQDVPQMHLWYGDTTIITMELAQMKINEPIVLENIYYDYDKAEIRPDAEKDLKELAETMQDNPEMTIRLESHCDSRGTDTYNDALALRRAKSAAAYLEKCGIDSDRITFRSYGEDDLVNDCEDGEDCTERQHQKNRRTEFVVTDWGDESALNQE